MGGKRILINGRFFTQRITGVQRYAREVIAALGELNQQNIAFHIAWPQPPLHSPFPGMKEYPDKSMLPGVIWQQAKLPLLARKVHADLLWSPCFIGPCLTKQHVVTIFDASVFAGKHWFAREFQIYYSVMLRLLGKTSKHIIVSSLFSRQELVKYGVAPIEKISVVHGGVSSRFTPRKGNVFSFPYVLSLGSRDLRKNIARLIVAWQMLPGRIKRERKLVIAGGSAVSFASERIGPLPPDIHMTGYVPDEDLPAWYAGADAFVYPSLYEGFGFPPLEAMACGCPVVVSNVASLPEVCGDAAYYVDPYNVESIAEGMYEVLTDDTLRKSLIEKGLERIKLFSWEKSAKEHIKVFEEVLNS